jgi:hypothetical protein
MQPLCNTDLFARSTRNQRARSCDKWILAVQSTVVCGMVMTVRAGRSARESQGLQCFLSDTNAGRLRVV